jgi:hypothetical protein
MSSGPIEAPFQGRACPFCGLATDVPHETQQGCIEALHVEIARMRGILSHLRPLGNLNSALGRPDETSS